MTAFREDIENIEFWLQANGMSEAELGRQAAGNPEALEQLRAGTAPPATLLNLICFIKMRMGLA